MMAPRGEDVRSVAEGPEVEISRIACRTEANPANHTHRKGPDRCKTIKAIRGVRE